MRAYSSTDLDPVTVKPFQSENFAAILAKPGLTLLDLIGSMRAYSSTDLDPVTVREKCLERDLVNMQMKRDWVETAWVQVGKAEDKTGLDFTKELRELMPTWHLVAKFLWQWIRRCDAKMEQ